MSCPFSKTSSPTEGKLLYAEYLMLDKVLRAQKMRSLDKNGDKPARDEHLFIIIHQTYELWFKEILYELDIVRDEFSKENPTISEVIKRLNRIVMILKLLVDQILILETMTPMDFNDFRKVLDTASGFQSMQFRLIENKFGIRMENRTTFNQKYCKVFENDQVAVNDIETSLSTPSLLQLVERWLENTPHMNVLWKHFKNVIETKVIPEFIEDNEEINNENGGRFLDGKGDNVQAIINVRDQFETIFDSATHDALVRRGERKISLDAFRAAIVINLYKTDAMFASSHQILMLLIDIDAMVSRWRYNHVLLVQRMIGSMQVGTGGSSGYQYLRSTLSDRCKPFIDLVNLTTFLVNKTHLQPLDLLIDGANSPKTTKLVITCNCKKGKKTTQNGHPKNGSKQACDGHIKNNKNGPKQRYAHSECNNITNGFKDSGIAGSDDERKHSILPGVKK